MFGILINRRINSNINEKRDKSSMKTITHELDQNETDVDREYESIEDCMNTSNTPAEVDINLVQNQAYASVQH